MEEEARAAWEEVFGREQAHRDALEAANAASRAVVADVRQQHAAQLQAGRHDLSSTQACP